MINIKEKIAQDTNMKKKDAELYKKNIQKYLIKLTGASIQPTKYRGNNGNKIDVFPDFSFSILSGSDK